MTAYVVIDLDVNDPAGFQQYVDAVTPLIEKAGARNLLVDDNCVFLEGEWRPTTLVIHEFESKDAARRFWDAPEYQPLKALRRNYSRVSVVVGGTAA
ncbi:DUF1330 domain-containing protein [Streptomyces sp. NPDC093568]|uniref:DUF1330 domain-containing protein n=1 Tax=Streptomyces sp. NPDC093568 TaxID=3366041 RepID=UPI003800C89D